MKREEKMSTGIGNGVAITHGSYRGINGMAGAIGISHSGIDYNALDNKPVHVIFLLFICQSIHEKHVRVFNQLFNLAQSEIISAIKNAKNTQDVLAVLSRL
jgi:mannitol/fructose-specific phosphotransferase system IIA component (Ntr-type)